MRPSMVVMSVTLAHAILCGSLATRMIHRLVRGEKYFTVASPHRGRFDRYISGSTAGTVRYKRNALVSEEPTAPQPVSPKCVMTLCLRAAQICLLFMSSGARVPV